jgi:hypothetical protein
MGFRLSSFIGGMAKGFSEQIEKQEEVDTKQIQNNIKAMYLGYAEQKKDITKRKDELRGVYDFFKGVKFSDGTLDNDQMIGLLSNPALAKTVQKKIEENPEYVNQVSKNFVQATANAPKDVDPAEWIDTVFGTAKATSDQVQSAFADSGQGNFLQRLTAPNKMKAAKDAASTLGVSLEDLLGANTKGAKTIESMAEVDIGAFHKKKEFRDVKDQAQMALFDAQESGDPAQIATATQNIGRIVAIEEISKTSNKTEAQIQSDLITEIQQKQAANDKQGAATATALLRQRQALEKAPGGDGKTDADKISQSNLIQVATRTRATTIEQQLPPGQLITTTDAQGNVTMTLRDLSQGDLFRRGDAIAANAIIKEMTRPDGTPRSEMHKNAMMSAGIRFDDAGKAIKPVVPELPTKGGRGTPPPAAAPAPAAPAARGAAPIATPRGGTAPAAKPAAPVLKWNPATNSWE